jgi:flavin-binding protein dodecin
MELEVVGTSPESFIKAVDDAVTETTRAARCVRWVRVKELECREKDERTTEYHAVVRIYYDSERSI